MSCDERCTSVGGAVVGKGRTPMELQPFKAIATSSALGQRSISSEEC